jgi:glycine cleavage system transcriptional repressor
MKKPTPSRYVITVLVADRVAILRDITSAVTDMGANIDGISQTVVEGYFTVILTAAFPAAVSPDSVRNAILQNFAENEASVVVIPYDARRATRRPVRGDRYVVTLTGLDRLGILKTITGFLAEKGINIEDWHVDFGSGGVTQIGQITVPSLLDIKQLQDEFRQALAPLNLASCIQHENIFRATNEVGAIRSLLEEKRE